jgi:3-deoxy-D-manno-octulosonic-acid transferase
LKIKGIYLLYRVLQAIALPALLLYFVLRGFGNRAYWESLPQRFGFLPRSIRQTGPGAIWLHAVSVGEVLSCVEFLRQLRAAFPRTAIFVSSTTVAGHATAQAKLAGLADAVFYAPADYVFAVRRVLRTLRPSVVAIAETEIWPNWFREVKRVEAGLAIVNGRISDRALERYRKTSWFFRAVMPAADAVLAQTEEIRERFLALGAHPDRTLTSGNFKYDFTARPAGAESPVIEWIGNVRPSQVWVAASTMPPVTGDADEDAAVLDAFRAAAARNPGLLLIWAPRKPEHFDAVAAKLEAAGVRFTRRSALGAVELPGVLLLDTIGELSGLFAAADVVFMGGTLANRGGHNILEPALFGKPVIVGPHMENFQAIADEFSRAGAVVRIDDPGGLAVALERLLTGAETAREIGRRARACAESQRGASARAVETLRRLYVEHVPCYRPAQPWYPCLWLLARAWERGSRRRQASQRAHSRRLAVPVISIGNVTMGGTGKTPAVLLLAEFFKTGGHDPAILTRGYGRGSPGKYLTLAAGADVSTGESGDEPQIFLRSGVAPVGIGADRSRVGALMVERFPVDVCLLDDGFQHLRLERDLDIVLVDALNPFGDGDVFPMGRLREPVEGLARADIILITRCRYSDMADAIERTIRRWNRKAPIFRGSVEPEAWVSGDGRRFPPDKPPFERAGAFCGLGNPRSFLRTLEALGIQPVEWVEFRDHHSYKPQELRRMASHFMSAGASAALTTQKDAVNLCEGYADLLAPLPLYWLEVRMAIEREREFLERVGQVLSEVHD